MTYNIDREEMRFLRREWINYYLHFHHCMNHVVCWSRIKDEVRVKEVVMYGKQLKVY